MGANIAECEKAGIDPKDIERIIRGLEKYGRQAEKIGVTIFGGSGSGTLRIHDSNGPESMPLILGSILGGSFDGGDGSECEDDEGFMRGE